MFKSAKGWILLLSVLIIIVLAIAGVVFAVSSFREGGSSRQDSATKPLASNYLEEFAITSGGQPVSVPSLDDPGVQISDNNHETVVRRGAETFVVLEDQSLLLVALQSVVTQIDIESRKVELEVDGSVREFTIPSDMPIFLATYTRPEGTDEEEIVTPRQELTPISIADIQIGNVFVFNTPNIPYPKGRVLIEIR